MRTRESVNTMVDKDLKRLFESTRGIHNLSFGDLLDKAIRELLITLNQSPIIDQEIARKEMEVGKLIQEQTELKTLRDEIKKLNVPSTETKSFAEAEELESFRNNRFVESYKTKEKLDVLKSNLVKGNVNWERIVELYRFKNKDEARTWMERKVLEAII